MARKPSPMPNSTISPSFSPYESIVITPARSRSKESPVRAIRKSRSNESPVRTSFKRSRSKESPARASPGILRSGTNRTTTPPISSSSTTPTGILRGASCSGGGSSRTGGDYALSKKESPPLPYRVSFCIDDESKSPTCVRKGGQESRLRMNTGSVESRREEHVVTTGSGLRGKVSSSTEALGGGGRGSLRGRGASSGEEIRGSRRGRPGGSGRGNGNRKPRKLRRHVSDVTDDLRKTGERMRRLEGEHRPHSIRRSTSDVGYGRPRHHAALGDPVRPYPLSSNLIPSNRHRRDKWKQSPSPSFSSNQHLPQGFVNYHIRLDDSQESVAPLQNQFTKYFEGLDGPDRLAVARVARDNAWAETIKDFEEPHEAFQDMGKFPWGEHSPKERRRRLAVAVVGTVSLLLLVASVLFVIVTLHRAPDIDNQVRKENEDIFRDLQAAYDRNNTDLGGTTSEDVSEDVLASTSAEPFPSSSSYIHGDNIDNSGVRSDAVENSGNEG